MIWTYKTTVDLDKPNQPSPWKTIASVGNKKAHGFEIRVVKSGKPVDLTGSTVELSAKRQDGATRYLKGKITDDNAAVAELDASCYEVEGQLKCTMTISRDDTVFSAACIYLLIDKADGDGIVDPSHTIPSIKELLEQIDATHTAAQTARDAAGAANTAAGSATAAASAANTAAGSANAAASAANTAAGKANTAAGTANAAAARLDGLTATATGLAAGSKPTVSVTTGADGAKVLAFGIPKGDKGNTGATPQLTIKVLTGAPGTQAQVSQSGTAENPVITLTIPRGDTGDIGKLTVNGVSPDASGAVALGIALAVDGSGNGTLTIGGGSA